MILGPPPSGSTVIGVPPQVRRPDPLRRTRSAAVEHLASRLAAGEPNELDRFWRDVEQTGTPLIEAVDEPDHVAVTFLWRGGELADEITDVLLIGNKLADGTSWDEARFERLPRTDVWSLSLVLGAGWRGSYMIAVLGIGPPTVSGADAEQIEVRRARATSQSAEADLPAVQRWFDALHFARRDPLAREQRDATWSVASGPSAPSQRFLRQRDHPSRTLVESRIRSAQLDNERVLWCYELAVPTPAAVPLLVLLDGEGWAAAGVHEMFDNMIEDGAVEPFAAVLVASSEFLGRVEELACNPAFVDFLADEVVPRARSMMSSAGGPVVVAGQSLGGLTALYAAMSRPDRFERVISQSGSFWWPGGADVATSEWLTAQVRVGAPPPSRVYLEVGTQEWVLLEPTRRLAAALQASPTVLTYREFDGGHDPACWRGGLADGLIAVLGGPHQRPPTVASG